MEYFMTKALNFYRYKTFVIFKSVTFEIFLKIMESVGGDANSVFHEDQKIFKSDTIFVTFEIFRKCSESVHFARRFENYNSFVPVEVQSQRPKCQFSCKKKPTVLLGPISSTVTSCDFNYYVNDKRD